MLSHAFNFIHILTTFSDDNIRNYTKSRRRIITRTFVTLTMDFQFLHDRLHFLTYLRIDIFLEISNCCMKMHCNRNRYRTTTVSVYQSSIFYCILGVFSVKNVEENGDTRCKMVRSGENIKLHSYRYGKHCSSCICQEKGESDTNQVCKEILKNIPINVRPNKYESYSVILSFKFHFPPPLPLARGDKSTLQVFEQLVFKVP